MLDTNSLISSLGGELTPAAPLRPPLRRALLWLMLVGVVAALAVTHFARLEIFMRRMEAPRVALENLSALLTGVVSITAAFYLSLPDRSALWRYAPLPPLLLWVACSGLGCLQNGSGMGPAGARLGESPHCFEFILIISIPLGILLFAVLRRARPLAPLPVALCGALGVGALAAFVLQFFHPFEVTVVDLALHALAVAVTVGLAALVRVRALASV